MTMTVMKMRHVLFLIWLHFNILKQAECSSECSSLACMDLSCSTVTNGQDCYYYFSNIPANWTEAQNLCKKLHMQGAIIVNDKTNDILKSSVSNSWLAGTMHPLKNWTFVNGNEASIIIETSNINHCVFLSWRASEGSVGPRLTFSTKPCSVTLRFFCRFDNCNVRQKRCTVLSTTRKGWFEARRICKENGGDLLYLKSHEVTEDLRTVVSNGLYSNQGDAYIGVQHSKWMWHLPDGSEKELLYSNWDYGQPSQSGDCVHLHYYDTWGSDNCSSKRRVLCMKHLHASNDATPMIGFGNQGLAEIRSNEEQGEELSDSDSVKQNACKENVAVNGILLSVAIGSSVLMFGLILFIMCRGLKGGSTVQRNSSSIKLREVSSWVEEDDEQNKRMTTELTTPVAVQSMIQTPVYETVEELRCDDVKHMKNDQPRGAFGGSKHGRPKTVGNCYQNEWSSQRPTKIGGPGTFKVADETQQESNVYAEIDHSNAHGSFSISRNNPTYYTSSNVYRPKGSIDDGETIIIDNQIYA